MTFEAETMKRVVRRFGELLQAHRESLNRLNVFPVPDGDTGTNMGLTVEAATSGLDDAESFEEVADAVIQGSLMGARGNSGVILSQILQGLLDGLRRTRELTEALDRAAEAAYEAVLDPQEGTILTVARAAADEAGAAGPGAEPAVLLERAYEGAETALLQTPSQLPVLREAGVVDAGGAGLLLLFAAFCEEAAGSSVELPMGVFEAVPSAVSSTADGPRFEVMFLLDCDDERVGELRSAWGEFGESVVIVGGSGTHNCHIHTDDVKGSLEAGEAIGRVYRRRITDLHEQIGMHEGYEPTGIAMTAQVGVVPVVSGPGIREIFRQFHSQGVVEGGQSANPSTNELLAAVEAAPADTVVLLPNNRNVVPVASQIDELTDKSVVVVPTTSVMQGVKAMMEYLPDSNATDVVADMRAAAASAVDGEVARAVRDAKSEAGRIVAGDWLGVSQGRIVVVDDTQTGALVGLLDRMVSEDAEVITLVRGEGADHAAEEQARKWLTEEHPDVWIESLDGGQPLYPYYVLAE